VPLQSPSKGESCVFPNLPVQANRRRMRINRVSVAPNGNTGWSGYRADDISRDIAPVFPIPEACSAIAIRIGQFFTQFGPVGRLV